MKDDKENNPFVAIAAVTGGIFLVLAIVFLIFAKDKLDLLVPLLWGFVLLGVLISFFALLSAKKKR